MVLGILLIVLACFLNAVVVLIPTVTALICTEIFLVFLRKLKLRNDLFEQLMITAGYILSLLFAASLQVYIWRLFPAEEGWRWSIAVFSFVLGTACMLIGRIYTSESPYFRAWAARRFMIGVVLLSATLAVAYSNVHVFVFVQAAPSEVRRFLIGEIPQK